VISIHPAVCDERGDRGKLSALAVQSLWKEKELDQRTDHSKANQEGKLPVEQVFSDKTSHH
jgi:hypothetical protein